MRYELITYEKKDHVMVVNLPEKSNYPEQIARLVDELSDLCETIQWDEDIRVVVVSWRHAIPSQEADWDQRAWGSAKSGRLVKPLAACLAHLDVPVIGCINGDAVGQALELMLACDIRLATGASKLGLPQIKTGMIPAGGGTQRLSRLVGRSKALELILTGEIIDAHEASKIGMINRVVEAKNPLPAAMALADKIAAMGPVAVKYAKEAVHKGLDLTLDQGLRLEADLYYLLHTTRDRKEGVQAFQEKRKADFRGQ